jgi:hypothetical protein
VGNQNPISLLNMACKIYAKALQLCLQPILINSIHNDQFEFLPFNYIFNNLLLAHKNIDWARQTKHHLIYLKLDFANAYDKVSWDFLFMATEKLGIAIQFIGMTIILFHDVKFFTYLNLNVTSPFTINVRSHKVAYSPPTSF